jgi:hypothetical protein
VVIDCYLEQDIASIANHLKGSAYNHDCRVREGGVGEALVAEGGIRFPPVTLFLSLSLILKEELHKLNKNIYLL